MLYESWSQDSKKYKNKCPNVESHCMCFLRFFQSPYVCHAYFLSIHVEIDIWKLGRIFNQSVIPFWIWYNIKKRHEPIFVVSTTVKTKFLTTFDCEVRRGSHSVLLKKKKNSAIKLLHKCLRGNEISPLQHKCQAKRDMRAEGVQFYFPASTYPVIVVLVLYFIA